jgi:hypothetical protein
MGKQFTIIIWGIVFIVININVGFIDIMPDVLGYMFIISGVSRLYNETKIKEFRVASYIGSVCIVVRIITFLFYISQGLQDNMVTTVISIVVQLLILILAFYIYEAVIKFLKKENIQLMDKIESGRNFFLYVQLIIIFTMTLSLNMKEATVMMVNFICGCVFIITLTVLAVNMYTVKRYINSID